MKLFASGTGFQAVVFSAIKQHAARPRDFRFSNFGFRLSPEAAIR
jgi:hypothetical protein